MLNLNIDMKEFDLLVKEVAATDKIVMASFKSSINRTARWLKTQVTKDVSNDTKIKSSVIRKRLAAMKLKKDRYGNWSTGLWFGTNKIPYAYLNPKQNKKGVKAGPFQLEGAFIAMGGQVYKRVTDKRLPIEKLGYVIHDQASKVMEKAAENMWQAYFFKEFKRQMEWRMSK